ncbi:venom protein 164-like [Mytilus trossulus]|uniref:venom protein 164-like n=1 Tax=Mytilus trossulus TaxID=6551 RepID=UPI003006D4D9
MQFVLQLCVLLLCLGCILGTAAPRNCNLQADCHNNECCLSNNPPRGKRANSYGHCVPLGHHGASCYVGYGSASTPPDAVTYACPCQSPLKCIGKQLIEVPLGEIGTCG